MAEPIKFFAKHNPVAIPAIPAIREGKKGGNGHGIAEIAEIAGWVYKTVNCEKPLDPKHETAVRAWLTHIGETDAGLIAETIQQCRDDPEALAYYLKRAEELPNPPLVMCAGCQHFRPHHAHGKGSGGCSVGVMPKGISHWHDTQHECGQFEIKDKK